MKLKLDGSVYFANGDPAADVTVRVFDKDAQGKQDDDLTISAGITDEEGKFSLTYEPLRYLDYLAINTSGTSGQPSDAPAEGNGVRIPDLSDVYLPYLRFDYTFNGQDNFSTASLGLFQTKFFLPEYPGVEFLPSTHGFRFANSFPGYFLPFSPPAFMSSGKVSSKYGLCGGMCAAAYDYALASRPIPATVEVPKQGTRLHRYLFRRQMDSLGGFAQEAVTVAHWTSLPDDTLLGTWRRTADEFWRICQKLDQKNLVVLALIYAHATSLRELSSLIFTNHQVLAYAYQVGSNNVVTINVYDPNLPGRDDVVIRGVPVQLGEESANSGTAIVTGLQSTELVGNTNYREVRGFFAMPYSPVKPPQGV